MAGLGLVELLGNLNLRQFTLPPSPLQDLQCLCVFYIQVYLSMESLTELLCSASYCWTCFFLYSQTVLRKAGLCIQQHNVST